MYTVLINFKSLFDLDCQFLFSALKNIPHSLFFSLHAPIWASLAWKLFWNGHKVEYLMKKQINFFTCHWSHRFPPALPWLLCLRSVSPAGHYLFVLYYQSAFSPVWCQLPFIPFLDFLTNSYMEWGDGRECWFSHLLCSMFCDTLEATLTAECWVARKSFLTSPKLSWVPAMFPWGMADARRCRTVVMRSQFWRNWRNGASSLTDPGCHTLPERLMQIPRAFPQCSGHLPSRHSSPGRNGGCLREEEGHREVTARW